MNGAGALTFARYAYPPNALGYCGPADAPALLEYAATTTADPGLAELARQFEGAWPYLRHIAASAGIADPLDPRVVEAYWIGGPLLRRAGGPGLVREVVDRFGARAGADLDEILEVVRAGAVPHHNFHVVAVSPWIGLLRTGHVDPAMHVLDRCRIRVGRVVEVDGDQAIVGVPRLAWDGRTLQRGPSRWERFTVADNGYALAGAEPLQPGDHVAVHWSWICSRLTADQVVNLRVADHAVLTAVSRTRTANAAAELLTT